MKTYIKKILKKHKKAVNIGYADFETISIEGKAYVFAIGLVFNNTYCEFYINVNVDKILTDEYIIGESTKLVDKFLNLCFSFPKGTTIYFHNLSGFDGFFIMKHVLKKDFKVHVILRTNKIFKIVVKNVKFLDTFLFLNESLNTIANKFIGKQKISIDPNFTVDRIFYKKIEILAYLKKDVELLHECFSVFINFIWEEYKINVTKYCTIPALAFAIYRKNFYDENVIEIPNNTVYNYIKSGYFGGINEVFIPIGFNLKQYDVNSLYPYAMKHFPMPVKILAWKTKKDLSILKKNFGNFFGFAFIKIFVPKNFIIGPLGKKKMVN